MISVRTVPLSLRTPARRLLAVASLSAVLFPALPAHAELGVRGDLDRNGSVGTGDAVLALRAAVGLFPLTPPQRLLADVSGDGAVGTGDAVLILRRAVGLVGDFGTVELNPVASRIAATVRNNETVFEWPATGKRIAQLTFTQGVQTVALIGEVERSGDKEHFRLKKAFLRRTDDGMNGNDYTLFRAFSPGQPVRLSISVADADGGDFTPVDALEFRPLVHAFDPSLLNVPEVEVTLHRPLPERAAVGDSITVAGQARTHYSDGAPQQGVRAVAFVVPPNGFPRRLPLQSAQPLNTSSPEPVIPPGGDFQAGFKIESEGIYVVEINGADGSAVLNQPIYVGAGIPLLPGPLDSQADLNPNAPVDPNDFRGKWLALVNEDRARYGLLPLMMDDRLIAASQTHAADMAANNFVGHFGTDGSDPILRAARAGVGKTALIGENLASGGTPLELQAGLMASAVHRENLLSPIWKRVGLSASRDAVGMFYGTQVFAAEAGEYSLPTDFFVGLLLDAPLPTGFRSGQEVTVRGKALQNTSRVRIFFQNESDEVQVQFPLFAAVPDAQGRFSIPLSFTAVQAGTYRMGVSLDNQPSKVVYVKVSP